MNFLRGSTFHRLFFTTNARNFPLVSVFFSLSGYIPREVSAFDECFMRVARVVSTLRAKCILARLKLRMYIWKVSQSLFKYSFTGCHTLVNVLQKMQICFVEISFNVYKYAEPYEKRNAYPSSLQLSHHAGVHTAYITSKLRLCSGLINARVHLAPALANTRGRRA